MLEKILGIGISVIAGVIALLTIPTPPDGIDIEQLKKTAAAGKKKDQYKLAFCYHHGKEIEQDEVLAMHWLTRSAIQGYDEAQYALGLFFGQKKDAKGNISKENLIQSMYWLKEAADNEHNGAKSTLLLMKKQEEAGGADKLLEFTTDDFKDS